MIVENSKITKLPSALDTDEDYNSTAHFWECHARETKTLINDLITMIILTIGIL